MGFLPGWSFRKSKVVNGTVDGAQTNYQMKITIQAGAGADTTTTMYLNNNGSFTDFRDLRFTQSDGTTLLDHWIDTSTLVLGTSVDTWIEIPSIPASPNTISIYLYYGNGTATDISNGTNTFAFFDDFIDASKGWTTSARYTIDAGNSFLHCIMSRTTNGNEQGAYVSVPFLNNINFAIRSRLRLNAVGFNDFFCGQMSSTNSNNFHANAVGNGTETATFARLLSTDVNWIGSTELNGNPGTEQVTLGAFTLGAYTYLDIIKSGINITYNIAGFTGTTTTKDLTTTQQYLMAVDGSSGLTFTGTTADIDYVLVRTSTSTAPTFGASGSEEPIQMIVITPNIYYT